MALTSNLYVRSAIDFVHDMSAGLFPGAVTAAWMIHGRLAVSSPEAVPMLEKTLVGLWWILLGALVAIVFTGVLRLRYWRLNVRSGFLPGKTRMVLVKHTAFVAVVISSGVFLFSLLPG